MYPDNNSPVCAEKDQNETNNQFAEITNRVKLLESKVRSLRDCLSVKTDTLVGLNQPPPSDPNVHSEPSSWAERVLDETNMSIAIMEDAETVLRQL